jgi:hypothetical protein
VKFSFVVEYDSEAGSFYRSPFMVNKETNCELIESGSGYLRIVKDGVIYGTIDCRKEERLDKYDALNFLIARYPEEKNHG